jgi:glutaminase
MTAASGRSPIQALLDALHARYAGCHDGEIASSIPELANADPELFGICLATADGFIYETGDSRHEFTIQSISKPFVYGLALDDHGAAFMLTKVGVEPSGDAFNAISLHKSTGRPLNPMINAGAIATTGQVRADTPAQRLTRILEMFGRYTGRPMRIDRKVYESESRTGHRNRAIGHLLRNFDVLEDDPTAAVDVYFQQCSISVRCVDLALMGATLANQGVNPVTGERAIEDSHVENVLSVMASCGMYDFSGGWIYNVGMPAKSGVAGGVLAVLPGQLGIGVFSPRLDEQGNSARALKVCEELSRIWQLHQFNPPYSPQSSRRLSYTAAERTSTRSRHAAERNCLREHGQRIHVMEIQGNLAFSTAESIVREIVRSRSPPDSPTRSSRCSAGCSCAVRTGRASSSSATATKPRTCSSSPEGSSACGWENRGRGAVWRASRSARWWESWPSSTANGGRRTWWRRGRWSAACSKPRISARCRRPTPGSTRRSCGTSARRWRRSCGGRTST